MKTINKIALNLCLVVLVGLFSGGEVMANKGTQTITRMSEQTAYTGPSEYFTGQVVVQPLFGENDVATYVGAYVTFAPGARSNWHRHTAGQRLLVIKGVCWTQTFDGKKDVAYPGDNIWCPAGVKHWHGASPEGEMTHLSLAHSDKDGKNTVWLERVTDEQYNS